MIRQSGLVISAAADRQHLLLAARERLRALVAPLLQAREQRVDALEVPAVPVGAALGDQQIFLHAERREDAPALRHQSHAAAHRFERGDAA